MQVLPLAISAQWALRRCLPGRATLLKSKPPTPLRCLPARPPFSACRCFTCGKVIGNKWETYLDLLQAEYSEG